MTTQISTEQNQAEEALCQQVKELSLMGVDEATIKTQVDEALSCLMAQRLREFEQSESHLTMNLMNDVIRRCNVTDPSLIYEVYETVIFYTGDFPEDEGWGSSDTSAVLHSWEQRVEQIKQHRNVG